MFAILETGGKQYKVAVGEVLEVERIDAAMIDKQKQVVFESVLLIQDDDLHLGHPYVENGVVRAHIVEDVKAPKIIVFKKKAKKGYKRTQGHRQKLHRIEIDKIEILPASAKATADKPASKTADKPASKTADKPAVAKKTVATKTATVKKPASKTADKPATAKKATAAKTAAKPAAKKAVAKTVDKPAVAKKTAATKTATVKKPASAKATAGKKSASKTADKKESN